MEHTIVSWAPGTTVTLCNVPWTSDYRDIVTFDDDAALNRYLAETAGPVISINAMTYAKPGMPVKVAIPFNRAYKYNYLRVTNNAPNDEARNFYYFIQDVEYGSPDVTILHLQVDVWQTFGRRVKFGNCYIERGHIGIANANQMNNNGREYLTVPEGLDLGGEYLIEKTGRVDIGTNGGTMQFDIIVATTISFQYSGGDVDAPVINSATGSLFEGMPNGVEFYLFPSGSEFRTFMQGIGSKPWVAQGIVAVYAVPHLALDPDSTERIQAQALNGLHLTKLVGGKVAPQLRVVLQNWRDGLKGTTGRYRHLKKFLTYPYRVVELTTYSGNPLLLKPESMYGSNVTVVELDHVSLPGPRIAFYPYRYNSGGVPDELDSRNLIMNDNAEFLDMMTGIADLPMFSVVNNGYMAFLASNKNSIAYQHSSADWSQQKALAGNTLAYNNSVSSTNQDIMSTNFSNQAAYDTLNLANDTAMMQAGLGAVGSVAGGIPGGPGGVAAGAGSAAMSGLSTAIGMNQRNQQTAINTGLATRQLGARINNASYQRDHNKDYADFAARGDYENAIAGINARVQDARMIQPTTSGQIGGDAFNLAVYRWAIHAKVKVIQEAAMAAIGEYWLRYGYAVQRFGTLPDSLHVMDRFTYWKLRETYLASSTVPEAYRQTIRGIFEKGVTVWASPNDIGTIDISANNPLPGVTL